MKQWLAIAIGGLAMGLVLPPLVVPFFRPWSEINSSCQDINIKTGQVRDSRYLWFILVSEQVRDTALSLALRGEVVDVASIPAWHRVNTFCLYAENSPHHAFHSALSQVRQLEMAESLFRPTPEHKQEISRAVLTVWQQSGRDKEANDYLQKLIEKEIPNEQDANDGK